MLRVHVGNQPSTKRRATSPASRRHFSPGCGEVSNTTGLDLVEEFRAPLADRLAVSLINLKQIAPDDFQERPGPSVMLTDEGRKKVIVAYQKRKQREISHPLLKKTAPLGLVPHLQARILARRLRGEIPAYVPFIPG